MKLSDEERQGLSAEEIAALEADPSEDEAARGGTTKVEDAADPMPDDGKDDVEATKVTEAAKSAGEKPAQGADKTGKAAEVVEETTEPSEREPLVVPFNHQAQVDPKAAQEKLDALEAKFEAGELTRGDYNKQRDAIRDVLVTDRVAAQISARSQEQVAKAIWDRAVEDFIDAHKAYKDPVLQDALDARVKALARDPANDKLSDRQLLQQAHNEVAARFKVEETPATPKDKKTELADKRKPDLSDAPRTLAHVPAAADNDAADNEFAALERLERNDPAAYERALARMTPDQQERYLRAAA